MDSGIQEESMEVEEVGWMEDDVTSVHCAPEHLFHPRNRTGPSLDRQFLETFCTAGLILLRVLILLYFHALLYICTGRPQLLRMNIHLLWQQQLFGHTAHRRSRPSSQKEPNNIICLPLRLYIVLSTHRIYNEMAELDQQVGAWLHSQTDRGAICGGLCFDDACGSQGSAGESLRWGKPLSCYRSRSFRC